MRHRFLLPFFAAFACNPPKEAPAIPPEAPTEAPVDLTPDPGKEAGEKANAGAACPPSETVLYLQRNASLRGGPDQMGTTLTIYDNGHWAAKEQSGCLEPEALKTFTDKLAAAEIAAPPLAPGMARCMAMPTQEITVEAKGETATWRAPCGPSNPSDSLRGLINDVTAFAK